MASRAPGELFHELKVYELASSLSQRGLEVHREWTEGPYRFDLMTVFPDGRRTFYEIKSSAINKTAAHRLRLMAEYVNRLPNARFEVVVAGRPKPKSIEVDGLEERLYEELVAHIPDSLDQLSSRTVVLEVIDADVDRIRVTVDSVIARGTASVSVSLQYGSNSDQEPSDQDALDSFPLEFSITMDRDLKIMDAELSVDTRAATR